MTATPLIRFSMVLIRIVHRVAQRAQFPLHNCFWHRERVTPLRVDVLMDQGCS